MHKLGEYISLFWDLGGQQILRTIWKKYYQECHGIIYVVDVTDDSRLEEAANSFSILKTQVFLISINYIYLRRDIKSQGLGKCPVSDFAQ